MTNNTVIRTLTLTFIALCFLAMFVIASFSANADLRPAASQTGLTELSADAEQPGFSMETLFGFAGGDDASASSYTTAAN